MNKLVKIIAVILLILISNSCKKTSNKIIDVNKYNEYVTIFPEKLVSVTPKFDFFLKKKINDATLTKEVFTIKPAIKGGVVFNNNVVSFVPSEKLKSNQKYTITLHLSKLYDDIDTDLKDFTINVKTKELLFNVSLKSPIVSSKDKYKVEGILTASDVVNSATLSEIIKANYNGKNVEVNFDTSEELVSKVNFTINDLERYEDDKTLKISWNGAVIQSKSKGDRELVIPGKNNFKVLNVEVIDLDKQQIEISFSDPIKKSQDLKGLIQFVNTQKRRFTYKINNNVVTVYPKSSFKNKVDIEVFKGVKSVDGYALKKGFRKTLHFEQLKPSVNFIKSGTILPNSNNLKINFKAVNLRAVDATIYKIYKDNVLQFLQNNNLSNSGNLRYVGRPEAKYTVNLTNQGVDLSKENAFAIDLAEILSIEDGAMYRVKFSFNKEYSNYSCNETTNNSTIVYGKKEVNTKQYDNLNYYSDHYNNYRWNDREDPCTTSFYYNKNSSTNILATNLGAIVKKGNNGATLIAVTDLLTTQPVAEAKVILYNLQQQPIIQATTNKEGFVNFDGIKNAFFAVITKSKNTTYIKLNDGNALSMSKFDVSGTKLQKGIKGYIYGERSVWRPGDQLFLTFVLNDNANPIPENHPIKFELINPQGKITERKVLIKNTNNVYKYAPKTNQDAITGNWKLRVNVGGAIFNKTLKIETIKPNRLKIKLQTTTDFVKANKAIKGDVEVKWLHGAIARDLKLDINGKFTQTKTTFSKFKNYNFDDVTRRFRTEEFKVLKGTLNNEGKTSFSVKPKLDNKAPGMLKASFITKVYENGGDFSTDIFSKKVSPYTTYVGLLNAGRTTI